MKRDVIEYVSKCLTCQQVKVEHQVPSRLLNPVENHRIFLEYPLIYSLPFLYSIFPCFLYLIYFLFYVFLLCISR